MTATPKKIIVWSWSRDPSIIPVEKLIDEGKIDVVMWVNLLGNKTLQSKKFSYVPEEMLKRLAQQEKRRNVFYQQSASQLDSDLNLFLDLYSRVNYSKGRDYHEQVNLFHLYYQYFTNLLVTNQVESVVYFGAPHVGVDYILYLAAQALGVETLLTLQSHVANRFYCVKDIDDYGVFDTCKTLGVPIELSIPEGHKKSHFYMAKIKNKHNFQIHKIFEDCLRAIFPSRQPIGWSGVMQNMSGRISYARNYKKYIVDKVNLDKKFVYFPLQLQPELTTSVLGDAYADQLLAIEKLATLIPDDWFIYVKENPKQGFQQRGKLFFERLSRIPNSVYLGNSCDTYDLMESSQFVASVTGTACWEAISGGKPALVFGSVWYKTLPGIVTYKDRLQIEDIVSNQFTHEELELTYSKLMGRSIPGIIGMSYSTLYKDFSEEKNAEYILDFLRKALKI